MYLGLMCFLNDICLRFIICYFQFWYLACMQGLGVPPMGRVAQRKATRESCPQGQGWPVQGNTRRRCLSRVRIHTTVRYDHGTTLARGTRNTQQQYTEIAGENTANRNTRTTVYREDEIAPSRRRDISPRSR